MQLALLSYLAVAHFGRGRGEWEDAEHPPFWVDEVKAVIDDHDDAIEKQWKRGTEGRSEEALQEKLQPLVKAMLEQLLGRLYPTV